MGWLAHSVRTRNNNLFMFAVCIDDNIFHSNFEKKNLDWKWRQFTKRTQLMRNHMRCAVIWMNQSKWEKHSICIQIWTEIHWKANIQHRKTAGRKREREMKSTCLDCACPYFYDAIITFTFNHSCAHNSNEKEWCISLYPSLSRVYFVFHTLFPQNVCKCAFFGIYR